MKPLRGIPLTGLKRKLDFLGEHELVNYRYWRMLAKERYRKNGDHERNFSLDFFNL